MSNYANSNVANMRNCILNGRYYQGNSWKAKVKKMTDRQIIALYYSLRNSGKL